MATNMELIGGEQLGRNLTHVEREVFPKAMARAINRTTVTLRKEAVRDIAQRMGVKQKAVRSRTKIWKASTNRLEARIRIVGRSLNLIEFKARQLKRGVSAAPWGRRRVFPHAFITTIRGNKVVMVRRKRPSSGGRHGRLPIRPVRGPGIAKTATEVDLTARRRELVQRLLPERLERELEFYVSKLPTG